MSERLLRMRELARQAHAGQTRNGGRVPYWFHTEGVAALCADALARSGELGPADSEDLVLAALGHDLYEDTEVGPDLVRDQFGERVARWISELSNLRGDHDRTTYLEDVATAQDEVRVIKCADLVDNTFSVAYGIHDLGLDWVTGFFLPIERETRAAVSAQPFSRLPRTGGRLIALAAAASARLTAGVASAHGQAWASGP